MYWNKDRFQGKKLLDKLITVVGLYTKQKYK